MSDIRKFWQTRKELAEKLYKVGLVKKVEDLKKEVDKQFKGYDDPERHKEALAEIKQQVAPYLQYTLKFDKDLGPTLDKIDDVLKMKPSEKVEQAKKLLVAKAHAVVEQYTNQVKEKLPALIQVDGQVGSVLLEALEKTHKLLKTFGSMDKSELAYATADIGNLTRDWKETKRKAEEAHGKLVKDPKAVLLMKAAKVDTSFPCKFKGDLSKTIESLHKEISEMKSSVPETASKAQLVAQSYLNEAQSAERKYKSALDGSGFSSKVRDVFDPLKETLQEIVKQMERLATPPKMV